MGYVISTKFQSQKNMLGKADHGTVIMKQLKSPNFLAIFKNMLVQRMILVEASD